MQREKANFDILGRIRSERLKRNWTEYTMAKNAGLSQSTISTWYRNQLQPSVASIERICKGFGISLSEFFAEDCGDSAALITEEHPRIIPAIPQDKRQLLHLWGCINVEQRKALLSLLKSMINNPS